MLLHRSIDYDKCKLWFGKFQHSASQRKQSKHCFLPVHTPSVSQLVPLKPVDALVPLSFKNNGNKHLIWSMRTHLEKYRFSVASITDRFARYVAHQALQTNYMKSSPRRRWPVTCQDPFWLATVPHVNFPAQGQHVRFHEPGTDSDTPDTSVLNQQTNIKAVYRQETSTIQLWENASDWIPNTYKAPWQPSCLSSIDPCVLWLAVQHVAPRNQ